MTLKRFIQLTLCFLILPHISLAEPAPIQYENIKQDGHSIHVLTIDPISYKLEITRALNSGLGRESVPSMAKRTGAIAAINGGFFIMGSSADGASRDNLIIDSHLYSIGKITRGTVGWSDHKVLFDKLKITVNLRANGAPLDIQDFNKLPTKADDIILFNQHFHHSTLTNFDRVEAVIENEVITEIRKQGDTPIPASAYVLSFPPDKFPKDLKIGSKVKIDVQMQPKLTLTTATDWDEMRFVISGAPLLIANGKILSEQFDEEVTQKSFLTNTYARTAIGTLANGNWLIVVADHYTPDNLRMMSISETVNLLKSKKFSIDQINHMQIQDIQKNLASKTVGDSATGLTIPDLAQFMLEKGCVWAVNLDGGGSSTLYYNGRIVNHPMGDEDEGFGDTTMRRVADGIVVLAR